MSTTSPPPTSRADVPELVRRLGWIVAGLGAVVARRFLKEPRFFALILPLFGWLRRSARRFERAVARPVVVRAEAVPEVGAARMAVVAGVARVRVRFPARRAWLVRALGWEAAGYGSQLEALLTEPAMVALLAEVPAVGRIMRPLCRMLGVGARVARVKAVAVVTAAPVVARKRVRRRRLMVSPLSGRDLPVLAASRGRFKSG